MTTFNAGAIEAKLTLGRSDWTKDLRRVKKEITDLEKSSITIGIDADADNFFVQTNNVELWIDDLDSKSATLSVDADADEFNAKVEVIEQRLEALDAKSVVISFDADTDNAQVQMDNLERELDVLENDDVNIAVHVLTKEANAALEALEARLDRLDNRTVVTMADVDADNAYVQMDNLEAQMDALEADRIEIGVDLDAADAEARMIELSAHAQRMSLQRIEIPIDIDGYATAIAQLATVEAQVDILDGREIDLNFDVDRRALTDLVGAPGAASSGGGGYLGLLRILIYALILLSPVLAVSISSLSAAIIAFTAALVGAAGPALILGAGLFGLIKRFQDAKEAGDELSGPMQMLEDSLNRLSEGWNAFLDAIGPAGFELMAQAIDLLVKLLPSLAPLFNATAEAMGGVLGAIGEWMDSPEFNRMIAFFSDFGIDMLVSFLKIGGNLIRFFGGLFEAIAPFASEMMQGLEDVTAGWAEWATDLENNTAFQDFLNEAREYGPQVLDMLGSLVQAFMAIGEALEPFAGPMLTALTWFFDLIANMDTQNLTILIGLLAGLWAGVHIIVPLVSALSGGLTAVAGALGIGIAPLLIIIGAVGLLAYAIYELWQNNETFRNAVIDSWNMIKDTVGPIISDIVNAFRENWGPLQAWAKDMWGQIKAVIVDAMVIIRQIIFGVTQFIQALWARFGGYLINQTVAIMRFIGSQIRAGMQIVRGIFQVFRGLLTGDWGLMWEGLKNIGRGAVNQIINIFRFLWNSGKNIVGLIKDNFGGLISFFRNMPGRVASAVSGMWNSIRTQFVSTINDIIGMWNNLSFSINIPDKIPGLPGSFRVDTPNVPYLAAGAYLTEPTLAMVAEGQDPEIVAPEPKLREIVERHSGTKIDYGRMAYEIAAALYPLFARFGISQKQIEDLIEAASVNLNFDVKGDDGGAARRLARDVGYELRVLGYGGAA